MTDVSQKVRVSEIGQYIRYMSCERRFKLEINGRQIARELPFVDRLFNTLDPVLQEAGRQRENEWEASLKRASLFDLTQYSLKHEEDKYTSWETFAEMMTSLDIGEAAYGREIEVEADLGVFSVQGRIDFVLLLWDGTEPILRLIECKASRKDKTYHNVQVALYRMLVTRRLQISPLHVAGKPVTRVQCVVVRIDESTNETQAILETTPLDLEMEEADIARLLAADGALNRIIHSDIDGLSYQLEAKCDSCVFNVHCLPESARQRRLELLSISSSSATALKSAGITTIDQLADLDTGSPEAASLRSIPGFTDNLQLLQIKAKARRRTLPGGDIDPDTHEVEPLPNTGPSQLPEHEINGNRLVRIYLSVDYDYSENRIGALSAHVTISDRQLHTPFDPLAGLWSRDESVPGGWRQDPNGKTRWRPGARIVERAEAGRDSNNRLIYSEQEIRGRDVIKFVSDEWSGDYKEDTGAERQLVQDFLHELVDAIAEVAETPYAPIHFYVWSRSEMTQLVESCTRVGSRLLGHLRELLGCRESLEQLIYSCLQDEVDRRYGLGWTGRGLSVATSLRWFGRSYHWRRRISGQEVDLDDAFTQDIFDFKTTLDLREDGSWANYKRETSARHRFEIHSRFHDSLTAPYWRAYWRTLPNPNGPDITGKVAEAIRRYNEAAKPNYLREYFRARVHALRWVEENVRFKNPEIVKPVVAIATLPDFSLGVDNAAQASIDFLRLDQHVKVTQWITQHMSAPANRVPSGRTVPVREVTADANGVITALIDLNRYDIDSESFALRAYISEGSFVRLTPYSGDPNRGQTLRQLIYGGKTCRVQSIDWNTGDVRLIPLWLNESTYTLVSRVVKADGVTGQVGVFDYATIDENVSDFVADKADERIQTQRGAYVYRWFDPMNPEVPPQAQADETRLAVYQQMLDSYVLPNGRRLAHDQMLAALNGLRARVQLLQGPPGTGKTTTTAVAALLRILHRRSLGDIVLISAHTHTAVDTLLRAIDILMPSFLQHATGEGLPAPNIHLFKVHSSDMGQTGAGGNITNIAANRCSRIINRARKDAVIIIGGTTSALLKMTRELNERVPFCHNQEGFQVPTLIVDEASMMVLPHFLALASLVTRNGEIMLTGDHRQLAPILSHDWEREDRPPAVLYQPFASAYQAIQRISENPDVPDRAVLRSALRLSFRLPPLIRDLIARLYLLDEIDLECLPRDGDSGESLVGGSTWGEQVWQGTTGLYLILHNERESRQSNEVEGQIIEQLLKSAPTLPDKSVAIVTPHRAQRTMLTTLLSAYSSTVDLIDTVERLQGGERPIVIVSATASDPSAISASVEFYLGLNKSNVAFSRSEDRLIVVCSDSLLDHIPAEVEHYQESLLWKSLRALCSQLITTVNINGRVIRVFTPHVRRHSASIN
jgi:hypothetical protein